MLYSEIIAVCSQIHTKHINTLCGQNVEFLHVKLAVHKFKPHSYIYVRRTLPLSASLYNPTGSGSTKSSAAVSDH